MANLVLKPSTGAGNSVIIKDQGGGAVLTTADSGATIAGDLVPATPMSHRNKIINGNFDVWQRGSTFNTSSATYHVSADRWVYYNYNQGSATAVTRQAFTLGQTDVLGEPTYYLRHTNGSGNAEWLMNNRIEDVRTFAGQTATVSLWMKTSQAQTVRLRVDQNFGTGGSPSSIVYSSTQDCSVTTSWQKFTKTFSVASISGKTIGSDGTNTSYLALAIGSLGATSIASQSVDIAQVQFEKGNSATPFEHRSYADELERCTRYYQRAEFMQGVFNGSGHIRDTTSRCFIGYPLQKTMRVKPHTISLPTIGQSSGNFTFLVGEGYPSQHGSLNSTQATPDHVWFFFHDFTQLGTAHTNTWAYVSGPAYAVFTFDSEFV